MGPNSIAFILESWRVTLLLREHDDHTKHTKTFFTPCSEKKASMSIIDFVFLID